MGFYFSVLIEMIFAIAILRLFFNFLKRLTPNKDFRFPICGLRSCVVIETASDCDYSPSFSTAFCRADTGDIWKVPMKYFNEILKAVSIR